jgi:biotin carboxylase
MNDARLLVLGAGRFHRPVLRRLRQLGAWVVAVDRQPTAPGRDDADLFEAVDLADPEAVIQVGRTHRIDAVLPLNDIGVRTASRVADALSLVGPDRETAERANDKALMREWWRDHGVPVPEFRILRPGDDPIASAQEVGYPVIVKPPDTGGGGRGISVARDRQELEWSLDFARPWIRDGRLLIERMLDGVEVTVETLSWNGHAHVLAVSDKTKPDLRTRVATDLTYPARLPPDVVAGVEAVARRAVETLGVVNGPAHTELIVTSNGPVPVETGARGGGGHIFAMIVREVSGVDYVRESAYTLLGRTPNVTISRVRGCVYRFFDPPPGELKAVHGVEAARAMPGVLDIGLLKQPGDRVGDLRNSLERAGFAVVSGPDAVTARERADRVERAVRFEVEPVAEPQLRGQQE